MLILIFLNMFINHLIIYKIQQHIGCISLDKCLRSFLIFIAKQIAYFVQRLIFFLLLLFLRKLLCVSPLRKHCGCPTFQQEKKSCSENIKQRNIICQKHSFNTFRCHLLSLGIVCLWCLAINQSCVAQFLKLFGELYLPLS